MELHNTQEIAFQPLPIMRLCNVLYYSEPMLQRSLGGQAEATQPYKTAAQASAGTQHSTKPPRPPVPKLAVVLMCAGTRGDVQPFIALGLKLQVLICHGFTHVHACIQLRSTVFALFPHYGLGSVAYCIGLTGHNTPRCCYQVVTDSLTSRNCQTHVIHQQQI